jgi:hypothetical protein
MPDNTKAIKQVYDEGMVEVFRIVTSLESTAAQVKTAKQTAKDLTSMLVAHTLQSIEGRSALLSGLIVELNTVIDSIRQEPPYAGALNKFSKILTKAQELFSNEKKALV